MITRRAASVACALVLSACSPAAPAGQFVCVGMDDSAGAFDCNDVCAARGTRCLDMELESASDGHGCDSANVGFWPGGGSSPAVFFDANGCSVEASSVSQEGSCDDPLFASRTFLMTGSFDPLSVACCCEL